MTQMPFTAHSDYWTETLSTILQRISSNHLVLMYLAIWRQDVRVASISLRLHPVIDPVDGTERGGTGTWYNGLGHNGKWYNRIRYNGGK